MGDKSGRSAEFARISDDLLLTEKQRLFAKFIGDGKNAQTAARMAGYDTDRNNVTGGNIQSLLKNPRIIALAQIIKAQNERMSQMSRKKVLDGFIEAIEQAKMMSEPMTQIAGWREIGKMCGYYAPETKNINVNVTAQRVLSKFETMSDADLLGMIESDGQQIEGEARRVAEMLPSATEVADGLQLSPK